MLRELSFSPEAPLKRRALSLAATLTLTFLGSSCGINSQLTNQEVKACKVPESKVPQLKKLADKGFTEAQLCLGEVYLKEGEYEKGREYLFKALKKEKGKEKGKNFYLIGLTYLREGERKEARRWFWKALSEGYGNEEFFKLSRYISYKELKELDKFGRKNPIIYYYLGNYFLRNGLYQGALFYYQIAIRYGIKEARLKSAIALFKEGNERLAYSILKSEYENGDLTAARILGVLLKEKALSIGRGSCLLVNEEVGIKEFIRERVREIEKRRELLKEALKWLERGRGKREVKAVKELYLAYSFKKPITLPKSYLSYSPPELIVLCSQGKLWAEYILSLKLSTTKAKGAKLLYRKLFKLPPLKP
ncbi:tetratricopeptide repeat protein [Thermovibrio sp.]